MLFGRTPFRGKNRQKTFANVLEKEVYFPSNIPVSYHFPAELASHSGSQDYLGWYIDIHLLLSTSTTGAQGCEMWWNNLLMQVSLEAKMLIRDLLNRDPMKRLGSHRGANDIKKHQFFQDVKWPLIRNMVCAKSNQMHPDHQAWLKLLTLTRFQPYVCLDNIILFGNVWITVWMFCVTNVGWNPCATDTSSSGSPCKPHLEPARVGRQRRRAGVGRFWGCFNF